MKNIYNDNFLLSNAWGKKLYHEVAAALPIIDFHNHIDIAALASNKYYENIFQLWVQQDPYKHRVMRIYGIPENRITGDAGDEDKFMAWAECMAATACNPLFHWSCMELDFLIDGKEVLTLENANKIWKATNKNLQKKKWGALDIVKRFGVELLCTSDDLLDTLEHHITLSKQKEKISCLPSLRGDSIIAFNQQTFFTWLEKLAATANTPIKNLEEYKNAIIRRLDFFDSTGCLLSDHSLDSGFEFIITDVTIATTLFQRLISKEDLSATEIIALQSHLLHFVGIEYAKRKWKLQLHVGAHRYTSSRLRKLAGGAGGFACIGNTVNVQSICTFLDALEKENNLPKIILYTLNPADNAVFASITGSYSEDGVQGKIQYGPAWWYNDHYEGITQQLLALSSYSLLSTSIGMTTDSRSILSFTRHEYYRRVLCNLIGGWAEQGKLPNDKEFLSSMIKNISYNNIKNWIKK